ncbi:hypothetical protein GCM10010182_38290 [Actinomadura cremea]|nr:hypothetical protein GCM10010182_38290 [Actinomadura cremea]
MSDRSDESPRADADVPAAGPSPRRRVLGAALLLCAAFSAVRAVGEIAGGDRRTVVVAAGFAVSLLLGGLALNAWKARHCLRAAWIFPATLMFTGLAMIEDTGYGGRGNDGTGGTGAVLLGLVLLVASLVGCVVYGRALGRLHGSSGGARTDVDAARPEPWKRALGVAALLCAFYFAAQFVDAVADGDPRRLLAAVGYGTALLMGGLALNGWQVRLSLKLMWLFPATVAVVGMAMIADPDYGNPRRSGGAATGSAVALFGVALMIAGVLGSVVYAHAVRRHLARVR